MSQAKFNEITFTDTDVVNLNDYIPAADINPHELRPFLLHDHGFTIAVVFAACLQDAIDEAADAGKLDLFLVPVMEAQTYHRSRRLRCIYRTGQRGKASIST